MVAIIWRPFCRTDWDQTSNGIRFDVSAPIVTSLTVQSLPPSLSLSGAFKSCPCERQASIIMYARYSRTLGQLMCPWCFVSLSKIFTVSQLQLGAIFAKRRSCKDCLYSIATSFVSDWNLSFLLRHPHFRTKTQSTHQAQFDLHVCMQIKCNIMKQICAYCKARLEFKYPRSYR